MKVPIINLPVRWIAAVSIVSIMVSSCTPPPMTRRSIQVPLQKAAISKKIGRVQTYKGDISGAPIYFVTATTELHQAAAKGDLSKIDECIKKGIPVDIKDSEGDTPLHLAYYFGQKEAVDRLITYGFDHSVLNKYGDTPLDMQKIARAEHLLEHGAQQFPVYQELREMEGVIVTKAVVLKVIRGENCRRVIQFAVQLRIPGLEESLNDILRAYGDKEMAEDYLNSGSDLLYEEACRWAASHGYKVVKSLLGYHFE
jgi:hypothetical protein